MDRIRRRNIVPGREGFLVPAVAKSDGKQGIARTDYILPGRHDRTLGHRIVAIHDPNVARFCAGATDQQGAQDKASHQALKLVLPIRCAMTVRLTRRSLCGG